MRLPTQLSVTLLLISAPVAGVQERPSNLVELDHIILGINDLERGIRDFTERTGVRPQLGGENRGRGTHNALVSLGPQLYLEIVAPISTQADSTLTDLLTKNELTPFNWALRTRDIEGLVALLRARGFAISDPKSGSRVRPDSTVVSWRIAVQDSTERRAVLRWWSVASPIWRHCTGCRLSDLHLVGRRPERLSLAANDAWISGACDAGPDPRAQAFFGVFPRCRVVWRMAGGGRGRTHSQNAAAERSGRTAVRVE